VNHVRFLFFFPAISLGTFIDVLCTYVYVYVLRSCGTIERSVFFLSIEWRTGETKNNRLSDDNTEIRRTQINQKDVLSSF